MNYNRKKLERLTKLDKEIINLIIKQDTGHAQKCILSAVEHLRKAYIIKDIDPEMAHFRMITAEEEASRGIFLR